VKHFLQYGNSDQQSFRSPSIGGTFDYVTVPGTIAAYYPDATAAFVLSLGKDYLIDPRTPLFQDVLDPPRASEFSLSRVYGPRLASQLGSETEPQRVELTSEFYSQEILTEATRSIVEFQRGYSQQSSPKYQKARDRYRDLLALASPDAHLPDAGAARPPSFVLAPYFVARSPGDRWDKVNRDIWSICDQIPTPEGICPVVAVELVGALGSTLDQIPDHLSKTVFFWVSTFDERHAPQSDLDTMWDTVRKKREQLALVNLYGGFFSICLAHAGLWGFGNGLGYSESRNWPQLSSTGAPPARYYMPRIHRYLAPAIADLVVRNDPFFKCPCTVCQGAGWRVVDLTYTQLKLHFALARAWEVQLVSENSKSVLASELVESAERYQHLVQTRFRGSTLFQGVGYLAVWAEVLKRASHLDTP
jgi:hypothetical protein